jgi:hypothetical protein
MMQNISLPLLVNSAACSGVLTEYYSLRSNSINNEDRQAQFLISLANWILKCLNIDDQNSFWEGWRNYKQSHQANKYMELGALCRMAPKLLEDKKIETDIEQSIISMYNCYKHSLLSPRSISDANFDSHLDDKSEDLRVSEKVFEAQFRVPLINHLNRWIENRKGQIVVADIGAGNGRVLEVISHFLSSKKRNHRLIAIDPSPVARNECKQRLAPLTTHAVEVINGTLEDARDGKIHELIRPSVSDNLLIVMKGVVHDRVLDASLNYQDTEPDQSLKIYRDQAWRQVDTQSIAKDLTQFLNRWKFNSNGATLLMMESHLVDCKTINQLLGSSPVLPAYIGHALTAQYLISCEHHYSSLQNSDFELQSFQRLINVGLNQSIMSIAQLE